MALQNQTDFVASRDVSTVISLLPVALNEVKPGLIPGEYKIPACKDPMHDFEIIHIARAKFPVYIDENRPALIVPEPSDLLAESICRDYKSSSDHYIPGQSEPGLTWVRGAISKKQGESDPVMIDLISKTRTLQVAWFKLLVARADDDWARFKARRMISDLQVKAAKIIGIERDWDLALEVSSALNMIPCKFCRGDVNVEAIVCMHCQGILDNARYDKEFKKA